jgi:hypothetical protein
MGDFLSNAVDQLIGRIEGVFHLRFILQPSMAAFLAVRAGLNDARTGQPAYLWAMFSQPGERRKLILHGWKDVGRVFILACAVDAIYQVAVFHWLYPVQTLIVAFVLAIVPYVLIRGPVARFAIRRNGMMRSHVKGAHTLCL